MSHIETGMALLLILFSLQAQAQTEVEDSGASLQKRHSYIDSMRLQATSENRDKVILGSSGLAVTAYGASRFSSSRRASLTTQDNALKAAAQDINQAGEKLAEEIRQGKFPKNPKATISVVQEMNREDFSLLVDRAQAEKAQLTREISDLEKRVKLMQARFEKGDVPIESVQKVEEELEFKKRARFTYAELVAKKPDKITGLKGTFLRTDFKNPEAAQAYIEELSKKKIPTAATLSLTNSEDIIKHSKLVPRAWGVLSIGAAAGSVYSFLQLQFDVDVKPTTQMITEGTR